MSLPDEKIEIRTKDNNRVTMNPTNSDDNRAYPHSNTKSFASVWQIFEIEPS